MDCRKSLVLALGLFGAVGCVPENSVQPAPSQPLPPVVEKAKDPPKHAPKNPETCVAGGNFFAGQGNDAPRGSARQEQLYDQARMAYLQALDIDAGCLSAYLALGQLFTSMGDDDTAVKWYRKGLEKNPREPLLWLNLGMCKARHKEWDAAIDALRRAADLDPEKRQYQNLLGSCLARAGHPDQAFAAFCKGGSEAQAHYHLAFMLHHMKQDVEARQHLQASVQADAHFEPAQQLLAQLEGRAPADPGVMPVGFEAPPGTAALLR